MYATPSSYAFFELLVISFLLTVHALRISETPTYILQQHHTNFSAPDQPGNNQITDQLFVEHRYTY
jgi:hypothetical protein